MPSIGEKQQEAGKKLNHSCNLCEPTGETAMRIKHKGFKIMPQVYKGNAVLNANK
jgi:hypothetical protein